MRPWLELCRISNLPTAWSNVLAAWILANGGWRPAPLAWVLLGASLVYSGGMILNDAADVRFDRQARPERPIPSGRVSLLSAWIGGLLMVLGGAGMFVWGAQACPYLTGGLVFVVLLYDVYHKPWAGSVFVMGSCRTMLYLAAASAASPVALSVSDDIEIVVKAIALGGYIVGLSLVARHEGAKVKPGKIWLGLGILGLIMPILAMIFSLIHSHATAPAWLISAAFLLIWLAAMNWALRLMRRPPPSNIGRAVGIMLAAIPMVDGFFICTQALIAAVIFVASMPLLLLWQKKIAGT